MLRPDLERLLDCMAIADSLDGLLLYGASATTLEALAAGLETRLRTCGAPSVDRVWLGSADTEDRLWGIANLPTGWGGRGLMVPPSGTTRIVLIPDLSRLSLAAARAALVTLGADHLVIERRGQSLRLPVQHRFLAALADSDVVGVSQHLLERFALRVHYVEEPVVDRTAWLTGQLGTSETPPTRVFRSPRTTTPSVQPDAIARALHLTRDQAHGSRAPLALLRLAQAHARFEQHSTVTEQTVSSAARLLRLDSEEEHEAGPLGTVAGRAPSRPAAGKMQHPLHGESPSLVVAANAVDTQAETEARLSTARDAILATDMQLETIRPLPESIVAQSGAQPREFTTLRFPWQLARAAARGRGTIIGTRRSESLQDMAFAETLFAAAPFQALRRSSLGRRSRDLILRRNDLRSYRRAPPAGELLVLVLDYTSVASSNWLTLLVPFLAEAYAARAELCIVRVGAASASDPLRAERLRARNVLVPSVAAALDELPGKATPLADGLVLALRTIQETFAHGRASLRHATLVVVTDGRGNVTLDASRAGKWQGRVGREGIENAQRVARDLRALSRVRRVLINPGPAHLRDLPLALAATLDAELILAERTDG